MMKTGSSSIYSVLNRVMRPSDERIAFVSEEQRVNCLLFVIRVNQITTLPVNLHNTEQNSICLPQICPISIFDRNLDVPSWIQAHFSAKAKWEPNYHKTKGVFF